MFFETQTRCLCAIHAWNNMIGGHVLDWQDVDSSNPQGNYTFEEIEMCVVVKWGMGLSKVFEGRPMHNMEKKEDFLTWMGLKSIRAMTASGKKGFLCVRRNHFFALRIDDETNTIVFLDSTKDMPVKFKMDDEEHVQNMGRILKGVSVYCVMQ